MSVQELSDLHRRYVILSQRFRAAWVFHQLMQSVARVDADEVVPSAYAGRFQELYGELKEASQSLTPGESGHLAEHFDVLGGEVDTLLAALLAEDSKVGPNTLRQFFQKFRNYDEKILAQLTRFYLFACSDSDWTTDRRDKVDFLVTRLLLELRRTDQGSGGTSQQGEIFASFWKVVDLAPSSAEKVEALLRALAEIGAELEGVTGLEELTESDSLRNFREFKHSLGLLFFEPRLLPAVLETNLAFRDTVRRLYQKEEQRIAADYQRIFDLEQEVPVDYQLDQELTVFRQQVERFERRLQGDEMRLGDLAELRERARSLIPRLATAEDEAGLAAGEDAPSVSEATVSAVMEALTDHADEVGPRSDPNSEPPSLIRETYATLVEALGDTTLGTPARSVALTPEVYPFHLEAREVTAFRRLHEGVGGEIGSRAGSDPDKERFLLEGAALRLCLRDQVEPMREALDSTGGPDTVARARDLVGLGGAYLRRYDDLQEQALLNSEVDEARALLLLRIRLMREYSDLWLMVHQDFGRLEG